MIIHTIEALSFVAGRGATTVTSLLAATWQRRSLSRAKQSETLTGGQQKRVDIDWKKTTSSLLVNFYFMQRAFLQFTFDRCLSLEHRPCIEPPWPRCEACSRIAQSVSQKLTEPGGSLWWYSATTMLFERIYREVLVTVEGFVRSEVLTVYLYGSQTIWRSSGAPGLRNAEGDSGWFSSLPHWPLCRLFLTIVRASNRGLKWKAMSLPSEWPCNRFSSNRLAVGGINPRTKMREPVVIRHDWIFTESKRISPSTSTNWLRCIDYPSRSERHAFTNTFLGILWRESVPHALRPRRVAVMTRVNNDYLRYPTSHAELDRFPKRIEHWKKTHLVDKNTYYYWAPRCVRWDEDWNARLYRSVNLSDSLRIYTRMCFAVTENRIYVEHSGQLSQSMKKSEDSPILNFERKEDWGPSS